MLNRLPLLCIVVGFLSGCDILNPNFYQPPPPDFKYYAKVGASDDDKIRAMLECGRQSAFGTNYSNGETQESVALAFRCMLQDGFRYTGLYLICEAERNKKLPACQPNAVVPKRDPQLRLNSQFCKTQLSYYPNYKVCLP